MARRNFISDMLFVFVSFALIGCQESSETAVPKLIKNLSSQDKHLRNTAALKLGSYGKEADSAVPGLIKLLQDENGGVRTSAAFALRSIGNKQGLEALESHEE